jgi:hypothetical protein
MSRPEFVTNEDILRWSENIDNDDNIPAVVKDSAIIREVCYAGLWLAEELEKLNCTEDIITRIQFTAGRLSFGRDPWQVHQKMLEDYKNKELEFEKCSFELN